MTGNESIRGDLLDVGLVGRQVSAFHAVDDLLILWVMFHCDLHTFRMRLQRHAAVKSPNKGGKRAAPEISGMSPRKRFRFEIDLRQGQPLEEVPGEDAFSLSKDAFSPNDSVGPFSSSPGPEPEPALEAQSQSPELDDFEPLPAQVPQPSPQTVQAYRQLLAHLQSLPCGHRCEQEHETRVFLDAERKRCLRRRLQQPDAWLEEHLLHPDGSLSRKVYEWVCGPIQDLGELFADGLDALSRDRERFVRFPGYELRAQLYYAEEGVLKHSRLQLYSFDGQDIRRTVL